MSDQIEETVIIRFVADAQTAIQGAKSLQAEVDAVKAKMIAANQQSGQSFNNLAFSMKQAALVSFQKQSDEIRQNGVEGDKSADVITNGLRKVQAEYKQTTTAISQVLSELSKGTSGASSSFMALAAGIGAALGIGAVAIVKQFFSTFINYCEQAIESAYNFTKALFEMQVAINEMRRNGLDITFASWSKTLDDVKQKFGVFSQTDLMKGSATLMLYGRESELTARQIENLTNITASFAAITGRSFEDVSKAIGIAVSTGNIRGLYTLGISITRAQESAEAMALGFGNSSQKLSDSQRAIVMYNLLMKEAGNITQDATQYQNTLAGQIDATTAKITDATRETGQSLLTLKLDWEKLKLGVVGSVGTIVQYVTGLKDAEDKAVSDEEKALGRRLTNWEKFTAKLKASQDWAAEVINRIFYGKSSTEQKQTTEAQLGATPETLSAGQLDAIASAKDQIISLEQAAATKREDLSIDLQRDLARIEADGETKLEDLAAAHAQKMLDIANKASEEIANAQTKYDLDVLQEQEAYANQLADLAAKHNDRNIKIEEDYQEKLRQLREAFIMNLEDALEKRDARQVLRLIRSYNVDKDQATRNRDMQMADEERNYKIELANQERQEALRLLKLKQDLALRIKEIQLARDRELALETEANTKKELEQKNQTAKDLAARRLKYQQDLDDLNRHLTEQENAIVKSLADQGITTQLGMNSILEILNAAIGPGGRAQAIYDYYLKYVQTIMNAAAQAMGSVWIGGTIGNYGIPGTPNYPSKPSNPSPKRHAQGGLEFANQPTTATFGEAGPEMALFMPLSKNIGTTSSQVSDVVSGVSKSEKGKLQVEIMLHPGLEGRIIDKALNGAADVVLRTVRPS